MLSRVVRNYGASHPHMKILEAGCGRRWLLDLDDLKYTLVGIDVDEDALKIRMDETKDLDDAMVGDLRVIDIPDEEYYVIFCSFVLEHIDGVQEVLSNFVRWVKSDGLIIIRVPDRRSVFGFVTRHTPLWFHVLYRRLLDGRNQSGVPGYGPYPTVYDKVLSPEGIREFCLVNDLDILGEYGMATFLTKQTAGARVERAAARLIGTLSMGRLAASHSGLTYVIRKRRIVTDASIGADRAATGIV
ncbi:class I SAM-dependent methyltransferase [Arhodomonas sp. AD133]|uniref:class I SAM-dependent methyltransferase n=1 Tax=Arhodomonas sp. AD133 TaxID=3415009 RepID=UPI003EC10F6D